MLRVIVVTAIIGLLASVVLAECGRWHWFGDLFTSFRVQYLLLLGPAVLAAVALRAHGWACVALLCAIANGLYVLPAHRANPQVAAATQHPFRLVSFNVAWWNRDYSDVLRFLAANRADAILLLEVSPAKLQGISSAVGHLYPHQHLDVAHLPNGAVIFSRWPIVRRSSVSLGYRGVAGASAILDVNGASLQINAVHLSWPLAGGNAKARDRELSDMGRMLAGCTSRCIVAGDFNVTQWSSRYAQLLESSGMQPCAAGVAPPSWPSSFWPVFRIRIDHCLKTPDLGGSAASVGPVTGSDHLAIIHDLQLPPGSGRP